MAAAVARGVRYLGPAVAKGRLNGEAARALVIAEARGHRPPAPLDAMLAALKQTAAWPREDRIALGWALAAAERHGRAASTDLAAAAKLVTAEQQADGSYGSLLDTWRARVTLIESGAQPDEVWIIMLDRWVRGVTAEDTADAAAILLALDLAGDVMADTLRRACLSLLRGAQTASGGWGPTAGAAPRVLETALAVMALAMLNGEPRMARSTYRPEELTDAIAKGKAYLVSQQQPDGRWTDLSTSGWAVLALLAD